MCMGGGGGGSSQAQPVQSVAEAPAIAAQQEYRKQRANRLAAYDGMATDIVGRNLEGAANDNTPSGALKKLMGA